MSENILKAELVRVKELSVTSPADALYSLDQFISSGVESIGVWILKASIHFQLDQFFHAKVAFRKVLQRKPKNEIASIGLFHCLWGTEDKVEALEEMKRFFKEVGSYHQSETADDYRSIIKGINSEQNS